MPMSRWRVGSITATNAANRRKTFGNFGGPFDFATFCSGCSFGQVNGKIDRGYHAVGPGDSFAGNFKCSAVIGTGARKRKTERHIHTLVKGVKFQRDQTLIVIHAKYRIEYAFNHTV